MAITDVFSKRKRLAEQSAPDPYRYNSLPVELRRQIVFIWLETIGPFRPAGLYSFSESPANDRWRFICKTICKERGVFELGGRDGDPMAQCQHFLLNADVEGALDIIEVSFRYIERIIGRIPPYTRAEEGLNQTPEDAIDELNGRFLEHRVGYRYVSGQMVQLDSELLHREVTVPAIALLHEHGFEGALQEFMSAHDHYRDGEIKDTNVDALNAFESTLKTICDLRGWKYPPGAPASILVQTVLDHGLLPVALQTQFDHVVQTLKTGIPVIRNKMGGHGQGATSTEVADYLGAYSLHLLGATIVLLINAHKALK